MTFSHDLSESSAFSPGSPQSPVSLTCGRCTRHPCAITTTLGQRLRHYDCEGLRDNAFSYAAYPIAEMPHGRRDAFCLAAPLVVSPVERLGDCDGGGFRGGWLIFATHPMAEMPHGDGEGFCLAIPLAVQRTGDYSLW